MNSKQGGIPVIEIKCSPEEQKLIKRNIKADGCSVLCEYKPQCKKPKDITCGEYIVSLIKWEIIEERQAV
jgi:hypothetical protein